jgi:hypothetical protein
MIGLKQTQLCASSGEDTGTRCAYGCTVRSIPRPEPPPGRYRGRAVQLAAAVVVVPARSGPGRELPGRGPEPEPVRSGLVPEPARSGPGRELPGRGPEPAEGAPAGEPTRPEPSPR